MLTSLFDLNFDWLMNDTFMMFENRDAAVNREHNLKLRVGALFSTADDARDLVKKYAAANGFEVRVGRHTSESLTMECQSARTPSKKELKKKVDSKSSGSDDNFVQNASVDKNLSCNDEKELDDEESEDNFVQSASVYNNLSSNDKESEKNDGSDKKDKAKRERSSVRVNCGMHINFRKQKKTGEWKLTLLSLEHSNHTPNIVALQIKSKKLKITDDILKKLKSWTLARIPISLIRRLLREENSTAIISSKAIANAVSKIRIEMRGSAESLNVCSLLHILVSKKADDPRWIVEFEADTENRLTRVFWMSPEDVAFIY
jgi:hypothetical protein